MRFRVLWDQHERCPYLPDRTARLPLRVPLDPVAPSDFDALLAAGERRSGRMMTNISITNDYLMSSPLQQQCTYRSENKMGKTF